MYLFSLTASDHRSSGTTATVPVVPVKSASQDPSLPVDLEAIVCQGLEHGLDNVINSKLRNNPASRLGKEVVLLATSEMSQAEQNVLFYISGYMARKVAALPQAPADLKDACVSNGKDNLGFVEKFTEWTRTINRGGLRIPSQAFFLLVRSMDRVHSSHIDLAHMTSDSLNLVIMTDAVMEDINVKYHWEAVLSNSKVEEPSVFRILEYLTKLFLTVKGFAVARHLRSRLRTEGYSAKKNLSLRHELRN